ncbi:hypothetical protein CEXT_93351 [Caerostris extrusa]|uniref:Uncharacterized protein n=1 Tax=Caerostris extrusa TaxID=172846 RepID=A0AAV4VKL8_CAEEX|nr:hypothetical protein CEXT_93351 [Caerostris extrusa]
MSQVIHRINPPNELLLPRARQELVIQHFPQIRLKFIWQSVCNFIILKRLPKKQFPSSQTEVTATNKRLAVLISTGSLHIVLASHTRHALVFISGADDRYRGSLFAISSISSGFQAAVSNQSDFCRPRRDAFIVS